MAESSSKLILSGQLADCLGDSGKVDVSTTRCLGVFKKGPVQRVEFQSSE